MTTHETDTRLFAKFGARGAIVPTLLAIALACNVTALVIPFMEVDVFLKGRHTYSLPHSVKLMWDAKLYLLAVLILAFSILFPLAKLATLITVWFVIRRPAWRRRLLRIVEPLGKWSFLDIFVVAIIMVLTNDQLFIGAKTMAGVYFFIAAIALSMITTMVIERLAFGPGTAPDAGDQAWSVMSQPGWHRWVIPPALLIATVALVAALGMPFIRITQFLLKHRAYSVTDAVPALWEEHAHVLAVIVAVTLVAMPCACLGALYLVSVWPLNGRWRHHASRWLRAMWQWAMIDVFALALLMFLAEGDALIKTEIKGGLYMIVAATIVLTASFMVVMRVAGPSSPGPVSPTATAG